MIALPLDCASHFLFLCKSHDFLCMLDVCDVNYRFVYDEIYGYNITIYSQHSENEIKLENITNNFNGKKRALKLWDKMHNEGSLKSVGEGVKSHFTS